MDGVRVKVGFFLQMEFLRGKVRWHDGHGGGSSGAMEGGERT